MRILNTNSLLSTHSVQKIPRTLVYNPAGTEIYRLLDCEKSKCVGEMWAYVKDCRLTENFKDIPNKKTYYISSLQVFQKNQGYGRDLINFAKNQSLINGCDGRISLVAYDEGKSPHTFYKKLGFKTNIPYLDNYLDRCIKNKNIPEFLNAVEMFFLCK